MVALVSKSPAGAEALLRGLQDPHAELWLLFLLAIHHIRHDHSNVSRGTSKHAWRHAGPFLAHSPHRPACRTDPLSHTRGMRFHLSSTTDCGSILCWWFPSTPPVPTPNFIFPFVPLKESSLSCVLCVSSV